MHTNNTHRPRKSFNNLAHFRKGFTRLKQHHFSDLFRALFSLVSRIPVDPLLLGVYSKNSRVQRAFLNEESSPVRGTRKPQRRPGLLAGACQSGYHVNHHRLSSLACSTWPPMQATCTAPCSG